MTHGNTIARDGVDRCDCGCKYWENDRCIDCGASIEAARRSTQDELPLDS